MEDQQAFSKFDKVLLLEDDPGHALLIQKVLKPYAGELVSCINLQQAVKALKNQAFSLIVSDLHVPDAKESALVEKVLSLANGSPVLVLTSSTDLSTAVQAMKLGAKDYIVKNFNSEFRGIFSVALERTARNAAMERERKKLLHEMAVLRIAIENGIDGLAIVTADGSIEFSNSAFQDYVHGWGGAEQSISSFFSERVLRASQLKEEIFQRLAHDRTTGFWSTELSIADEKLSAFRLELASIPGTDQTEQEKRWVLWLRNISEEKRREKFQREILSTTTHDLKGPLGAIILSAELLSTSPDNASRVKDLSLRISSSAHGAVNLIDEFLSARRLQEGTFILKPTVQSVKGLLEDVHANYETMAQAKSISLTMSCDPPTLKASFDKLGLSRVLGNLITNAIKFTPKQGQVHVSARDSDSEYVLTVKDNGCGMEPSEVKKLFERFSRLKKHAQVEGTGLGLFVVRCIVAAHGGRIDVESTPGAGSTFEVFIPKEPHTNQNGELISLDFA